MLVTVSRLPRPNVEETVTLDGDATVQAVLRRLTIPLDAVIVLRGDHPLPSDAPVADGDRLKVISVFSGG